MKDEKDEYLQNIPMIKEGLKYKIEEETVEIILAHKSKIQDVLRKIGFNIPKETFIKLDEYSSFVFLQIDGKKSIYDIGQKLKENYKEDAEPLYERLVIFIDFLEDQKRWILFKNKLEKYEKK